MTLNSKTFTLTQLAEITGGQIHGDGNCKIVGVAAIQDAQPGYISFLANPAYRKYLKTTQASVVILSPNDVSFCPTNALIVANPYAVYARLTHCFAPENKAKPGIHVSAVIGEHTNLHPSCIIGPNAVIGDGVTIGANTVIGASCVVGDNTQIGEDVVLYANVTLYSNISIGDRVIIHSGAVIGSDGFGFAFDKQAHTWVKIYHSGSVRIEHDVEIGANTAIDRGAIEDTVIEHHAKIDNLVQIAHNVRIGAYSVLAGCSAVAGSATVGKYCIIGGAACIAGHIVVADQTTISGMSMVTHSLLQPGKAYSSGTGLQENGQWKKNVVRFWHLDELAKRVKNLEKQLANNKE